MEPLEIRDRKRYNEDMRRCEWCDGTLRHKNAHARFCSGKCRVAAHRATIPAALIRRDRWIRRDETKRPLTIDGNAASSTNEATWSSYAEAKNSRAGIGLGFVLGDGIGCIDLDHVLLDGQPTDEAATFLEDYRGHHIEVSPSGDGLHIWGTADPGPGSKRIINGISVERYTTGRYITITGRIYQRGRILPL